MKILPYVLIAILLTSLVFLGKLSCESFKLEAANTQLNKQLMQADLEKGRALTRFGDANKYMSELEDTLEKEIKDRKALITEYGKLKARYKVAVRNQKATGTVFVDKPVIVDSNYKFIPGMYYKALSEKSLALVMKFDVKFVDTRLDLKALGIVTPQEIRWWFNYDLNLRIGGELIQTLLPSGGVNHYVTLWELDEAGKKVGKFELEEFEVTMRKPNFKSFLWWNPKLDIGGLALLQVPNLKATWGLTSGISLMSYGLTPNDLDWRFLRLSGDITKNSIGLGFSPALYNVGQLMPLFSNVWIGPHAGLTFEFWHMGLFLGAQL